MRSFLRVNWSAGPKNEFKYVCELSFNAARLDVFVFWLSYASRLSPPRLFLL